MMNVRAMHTNQLFMWSFNEHLLTEPSAFITGDVSLSFWLPVAKAQHNIESALLLQIASGTESSFH